jgi:hypothetical protein
MISVDDDENRGGLVYIPSQRPPSTGSTAPTRLGRKPKGEGVTCQQSSCSVPLGSHCCLLQHNVSNLNPLYVQASR